MFGGSKMELGNLPIIHKMIERQTQFSTSAWRSKVTEGLQKHSIHISTLAQPDTEINDFLFPFGMQTHDLPPLRKHVAEMKRPVFAILKNVMQNFLGSGAFRTLLTEATRYFTRKRKFSPMKLVGFLLRMQGDSLQAELLKEEEFLGGRVTASAFVQAVAKFPPEALHEILRRFNQAMPEPDTFEGYRLFAIDGSDFPVPFHPASKNKVRCGTKLECCLLHANVLYDLKSGRFEDCVFQPRSEANERRAALAMIHRMMTKSPYIVIMDRGYPAFNLIEACNRAENCHYVIRNNENIKEIKELPDETCDANMDFLIRTKGRTGINPKSGIYVHNIKRYRHDHANGKEIKCWDFEDICHVKCCVVKFFIHTGKDQKGHWEILITNLDREKFPIDKLKRLYRLRWDVETSFRHLKYPLDGLRFHSRKDDVVEAEILARMIKYNAISQLLENVPARKDDARKYSYAINFKMAISCVCEFLHSSRLSQKRLVEKIFEYKVPIRPGRNAPRHIKAKMPVGLLYHMP